jgi:hypothetical protein
MTALRMTVLRMTVLRMTGLRVTGLYMTAGDPKSGGVRGPVRGSPGEYRR